jgi:adenosine deaminase
METFDFGPKDIKQLIGNAIRAAWCDQATKSELLEELEKALPGEDVG